MEDYSKQHKKAWEFDAYDFWVRTAGTPEERASKDKEPPGKMLKQYANYFDSFEGVKVANLSSGADLLWSVLMNILHGRMRNFRESLLQ